MLTLTRKKPWAGDYCRLTYLKVVLGNQFVCLLGLNMVISRIPWNNDNDNYPGALGFGQYSWGAMTHNWTPTPIVAERLYFHERGLVTSQIDDWKLSQLSELQGPETKPSSCLKTPWNAASSVKPSLMKWKWEPDVLQLHYKDNHIYSTT